jgi:ribosomal protein L40E
VKKKAQYNQAMNQKSAFVLILLLTFLLNGCVDIEIKTKINPDGTGVQMWTITTSALLATKVRTQVREEPLFKGLKLEFSEEYKEGDFIIRTRIPFQNVNQLKNNYYEVRLEKDGFFRTTYDYTETWKTGSENGQKLFQNTGGAFAPKSVKASVEVNGPIVQSNAERMEGQTAYWTIPIGEPAQNKVLRVQWARWNWNRVIVVSLLPLLFVTAMLIVLRGRKSEQATDSTAARSSLCTQCGAMVPENSSFCHKCGTKLE